MKRAIGGLVCLLLAGCGGTPPTRVFDLSMAAQGEMAAAQSRLLIFVDKPAVAGYFDRTQMVTRVGTNRLSFHEFEVWSEPPADLLTRAIVDDLAGRFGADRVMETPVARHATPDAEVGLDVIRFDVDEAGHALLDARWTLLVKPGDRLAGTRRERIATVAADPADPVQRVNALREAVTILSRRIADAIARAR